MPELTEDVLVGVAGGLHLRPAAKLVALAQQFSSQIWISLPDGPSATSPADARSMISLTALGAGPGAKIRLTVTGEDAQEAMAAMLELFERNFAD